MFINFWCKLFTLELKKIWLVLYQYSKQHTNLVIAQLNKYKWYNKSLKNQWNSNNLVLFALLIIQKHLIQSIKLNFGKLYNFTNIGPSYIRLLAKIYEKANSKVKTNFGTTNPFWLLKCIRQGDESSVILFSIILHAVLIFVYDDIKYGFKIDGIIVLYYSIFRWSCINHLYNTGNQHFTKTIKNTVWKLWTKHKYF